MHIFNMYTNTVQSLNNVDWKLFKLQITLSKYCLAGTDVQTEKAVPRPASAFGDAGKNQTWPVHCGQYHCIQISKYFAKENLK